MGKTNKIYFRKYRKQAFKKRYNKSKKRYNKSKKRYNKSKKRYNKSKKRYNGGTGTNHIGSMQPNELQGLHHTINTRMEERANARETKEINELREIEQKEREQKRSEREYRFSKINQQRNQLISRIISILDTNDIKEEAEQNTKLLPIPMELSIKCEKRECESDKLCHPWRGAPDDQPKLICGLPNMNKEPIYSYVKEILPKYISTVEAIKNIDWKKNYHFQKEIIKYIDEFYNIKGKTYDNLKSKIKNLIMKQ